MNELEQIKLRYEARREAIGLNLPKEDRIRMLKLWRQQIKRAEQSARQLAELVPLLPMDCHFDFNQDGYRDYNLLTDLSSNLDRFMLCLSQYEVPKKKDLRGAVDDKLAMELARLCPDPKCYVAGDELAGPLVDFLEKTLPAIGLPANKAQDFAGRYRRLILEE